MGAIDTFCAIHASGLLLPNGDALTALCLLFDKIYLPANVEAIREFSKRYKILVPRDELPEVSVTPVEGSDRDPFSDLTADQRTTALRYLELCALFARSHSELFGKVLQTNAYEDGSPWKVKLILQGEPGKLNEYEVSMKNMRITEGDEELFPTLIADGYIPVVSYVHSHQPTANKFGAPTNKQLAALLAMKSVQIGVTKNTFSSSWIDS